MAEVGILADAEESLCTGASSPCVVLTPPEATALLSELARLRFDMCSVAGWLRRHADRLTGAPLAPTPVPVVDGPTLVEIAAERDALRSRVAELERERDAQRATRRSALAQAFAAAILAEHREDNLPWDEVMRRAFDAADAFLATEKETP